MEVKLLGNLKLPTSLVPCTFLRLSSREFTGNFDYVRLISSPGFSNRHFRLLSCLVLSELSSPFNGCTVLYNTHRIYILSGSSVAGLVYTEEGMD